MCVMARTVQMPRAGRRWNPLKDTRWILGCTWPATALVLALTLSAGTLGRAAEATVQNQSQPDWQALIEEIVRVETWRDVNGRNEAQVRAKSPDETYWVFGWRVSHVWSSGSIAAP